MAAVNCLCFSNKQVCRDVQLTAENNRITVSQYATSCYYKVVHNFELKIKRQPKKAKIRGYRRNKFRSLQFTNTVVKYCTAYHKQGGIKNMIDYKSQNENLSPRTHHNQTANSDSTAWWTDTAVTSRKQKSDAAAAHKWVFIRAEPEWHKKVIAICVAGRDEKGRCR